jgi:hypothetical protein
MIVLAFLHGQLIASQFDCPRIRAGSLGKLRLLMRRRKNNFNK